MPPLGTYRHRVTVQNQGPAAPDGDGGYTEGWADATPAAWDCSITPATTSDLERLTSGTVASTATHLVRGRWHAQITTASRLVFHGRILNVLFRGNPWEQDRDLVLVCAELLAPAAPAGASTPAPEASPALPWDNA